MDSGLHLVAGLDWGALPQNLILAIGLGAVYALIALGYTMVYGVLKLINFAHSEVFMLGAYTALFTSYWLGFSPEALQQASRESNWLNLLMMLLASMVFCAVVGVIIEFFAYRPMRDQPRIASLITAIGVSLLIQYGGALVLPVSPPPSINEAVNPYRGSIPVQLIAQNPALAAEAAKAKEAFDVADAAFQEQMKAERSEFDLSPRGLELRTAKQVAERNYRTVRKKAEDSGRELSIPKGQMIMFGTTVMLMAVLTWLVLKTRTGRAMRAASHDFDTASLMGISVNRIVTITFIIGSALAGAGAMMQATFIGTPLTTFYAVSLGVKAFVAAVLGGIGNIPGAVLGGMLMALAETLVVWMGKSEWKDAIAFVILIVVLLFRPGGLLGSAKVEKV
ncbi:MAG TPA: branched-chain amino acid ABC transporter permease [Fimbriimonadaceae bacterium]|nr:branched-chain amino acid ABC transporter permease [Fimbriimonadaceae bacterium]